eukprot:11235267-Prorocentrum_lima.AAC.1
MPASLIAATCSRASICPGESAKGFPCSWAIRNTSAFCVHQAARYAAAAVNLSLIHISEPTRLDVI